MKKNLLIIMTDELRADITYHEYYPFVKTPNIDRLRSEGVTVHECFTQYPVCCPSRASILIGEYPHQFGLWNNKCQIPPEEETIGHHLTKHGYDVVAFGKTHNMNPGFRSYDYKGDIAVTNQSKENDAEWHSHFGSRNHGAEASSDTVTGIYQGKEENFCDFKAVDQFNEYLTQQQYGEKPFTVFLGLYSPHPPFYPPVRYANMYPPDSIKLPDIIEDEPETKPAIQDIPRERWTRHSEVVQKKIVSTYLGMITLIDDCVGRILQSLEEHNLLEETLIVFTPDHGEQLGEHQLLGKMKNLYDGSLKSPLIFRFPHAAYKAAELHQFVEMVDLYPTLCDVLDVPYPEGHYAIEGKSVKSLFENPDLEHRHYIHSMIEEAQMVRTKEWKLSLYADDRSELYDLRHDPREKNNLYNKPEYADIQHELLTEITKHMIARKPAYFHEGPNRFFG